MNIPTYLINLDGSDNRLRDAIGQLDSAGIAFQRVPAFDGRKLQLDEFPDYDAKAAYHYMGRPLRGGEIGCYLSHLDCARRFLETDAPHALVLEDDMQLESDFNRVLVQILGWLDQQPLNWDLINLSPNKHRIYTPLHDLGTETANHLLARAHYFPMTTTGLLWSRQGAQGFVDGHRNIFAPVDNYFRYWLTRTDRGLSIWPPLVTTTGAESEIAAASLPKRSVEGRHPLYGLIKQRRLLTDKLIAWRHKRQARAAK